MGKILKALACTAALSLTAGIASAGCEGMYCQKSMKSAHTSLSWGSSYDMGTTVVSGGSYHAGVASDAYADAKYGSGSISQAYTLDSGYSTGGTSYVPFSTSAGMSGPVSGLSVPGLGANEKLCPVPCGNPIADGGEKGRVLGCYAVCQTKPKAKAVTTTSWTQVVHPVIYVRYPVHYPVPVYHNQYIKHYSRYGDHAHMAGRWGGLAPACSYDYGYHGHASRYGYGAGCGF